MGQRERTEAGWLACTYPGSLLGNLRSASARKLRLFACACCRRVWEQLTEEASRRAVEAAEQWVDGQLSTRELRAIQKAAEQLVAWTNYEPHNPALWAAAQAAVPRKDRVSLVAWEARRRAESIGQEERYQCDLLRDIFGYPFRPVAFDRSWREANGGTAAKVAAAVYQERHFEDLPILADALEDAGCGVAEILTHCRRGGVHVRGCWVVDLVLGKK